MKKYLIIFTLALSAGSCGGASPDNNQGTPEDKKQSMVENVSVPETFEAGVEGSTLRLGGEGFMVQDVIIFNGSGVSLEGAVSDARADFAIVSLPIGFTDGKLYEIVLSRDGETQTLGSSKAIVEIVTPPTPPDPAEEDNVCGHVYCNGKGVGGVHISDGIAWTVTDQNGKYSFKSEKYYGYVFMIIPSGYDADMEKGFPQFWQSFSSTDVSVKETADFYLFPAENDKHLMVFSTDWHIAGRLKDVAELNSTFLPEMKALDAASSVPVYELALGDLTWDSFWYSGGYYPAVWKNLNSASTHPIFTVIGNHDYDYKVYGTSDDDLNASEKYRHALGPTFYSMNIGKVHYLVINDIRYSSTNGTTAGRNPREYVSNDQIAWMREDLSHVDKTTPVVLATHSAFYRFTLSGGKWSLGTVVSNASEVLRTLSDYEDVRIFCGHRHVSHFVDHAAEGFSYAKNKMIEYTVPPVGGTLWTTSAYCGFNLGTDGCPAGYDLMEVEGKAMKVRFKGIGEPEDYQMRFYDMNKVKAFWDSDTKVANLISYNGAYSYEKLFGAYEPNTVFLNVFMADLRGYLAKVEIFEDGKSLDVVNADAFDPQHVASYDVLAYAKDKNVNSSYKSVPCTHMFKAVASSATSKITAKVTDREGNVFTASLERPKEFNSTSQY